MRYRCPKDGRFVSEFTCMYCYDPPEPAYGVCREYNKNAQLSNPQKDRRGVYRLTEKGKMMLDHFYPKNISSKESVKDV